jgi:hypothetical protein
MRNIIERTSLKLTNERYNMRQNDSPRADSFSYYNTAKLYERSCQTGIYFAALLANLKCNRPFEKDMKTLSY